MTAELIIAALFALAGFAALAPVRRDVAAPARMWLSVPIGATLYLLAALVLILITGTLDPPLALGLTAAMGGVGLVVAGIRRDLNRSDLGWAAPAVGIALLTVLLSRLIHLTRLTPDSLRYLLGATDLVRQDALVEFNTADLVNRQIGLPILHSLGGLVDRDYVASISPLFGVFGLGLFVWLTWHVTEGIESGRREWLVAGAVLFLGASNRLVYDSFYINTHIQVAVFLLIAVAGSWLAVSEGRTGWALPAGLALAVTLLFRPEAPIVAAIVLISVAASRANWPVRIGLALPPVVTVSLWYGLALWNHSNSGDRIALDAPVFVGLLAVIGSAVLVLAGGLGRARTIVGRLDWVMLAGLALLLVVFGAGDPEIVTRTIEATFRNLTYNGLWLLTWVAAIPLLIVALIVHRLPDARLWTVPIIGFGLLWWLLPLIRGGSWRVGTGDSGNRILAHILPVLVAFLVLAAVNREQMPE